MTIVLSEGFNLDILNFHGYYSLYYFFMGFVGAPIGYKDGCKWTGSKNFTIKGITGKLFFSESPPRHILYVGKLRFKCTGM